MATQSRRADPSLEHILFEEGYRFDFFQAVRVLERLSSARLPVGRSSIPSKEAVRFRSLLALSFPASSIYDVAQSDNGDSPPEMVVAFMGLFGLAGVLPRHYTELLLERVRQKDFALRDFLDLFNHRMISLFYRAWEKYRFPVAYERSRSSPGATHDPFSFALFNLIGMGTDGLRGKLKSGDEPLLYYSGLIAQQPRSASALQAMLGDYFNVPVIVRQFIGAWLHVDNENRTRLGRGDSNNELGSTTMLGSRCWDQQAGFTLAVGPLKFNQFRQFLPSETGFSSLVELTRFFAGLTLDFNVQLVLQAAEVPGCRLTRPAPEALRLGWSSWLKTKEFSRDAQAVLASHLTRMQKLSGHPSQATLKEAGLHERQS
ncbi:MAG TPA: type VI secretion system baseplate subunit TssG [Candidatus Binatia bacterium]